MLIEFHNRDLNKNIDFNKYLREDIKMKLKKVCFLIIIVLVLALLCSLSASSAKRQIKISHGQATGDPRHLGAVAMADYINAQGLEDWEAVVYPANQLGESTQVIESTVGGAIEMNITPVGFLSGFQPLFTVLEIPFLIPGDLYDVREVMESEAAQYLSDTLEVAGLVNVAFWTSDFGQISSTKTPIRKIEDVRGLKMRTVPSPITDKSWEGTGLSPVFIPWEETYTALQTGAVDGDLATPVTMVYTQKFHEVVDYLIILDYAPQIMSTMASKVWWDSLTEEVREVVRKGAEVGGQVMFEESIKDRDIKWKLIEEEGNCEIIVITPEERERFIDAMMDGVEEFFVNQYGEEAKKILDGFHAAIEEVQQKKVK